MAILLRKYTFTDITVFARTAEGDYINLTDYQVLGTDNEIKVFNSTAPYLITFHSFLCGIYEKRGERPYVCEVTLEELKELTGQKDVTFYKRFVGADKMLNEEQVALFCAWKISEYHSGECLLCDSNTYEFYRVASQRIDGKYRKYKKKLFSKAFYEA